MDLSLSQYFINCVSESFPGRGNTGSRGCDGGSSYGAYSHAEKVGAVDSACLPYKAVTQNCTAVNTCQQNLGFHSGPVAVLPTRHFASEFGAVGQVSRGSNNDPVTPTPPGNEVAMMKEIYARGE